jgi:hypothetical protein
MNILQMPAPCKSLILDNLWPGNKGGTPARLEFCQPRTKARQRPTGYGAKEEGEIDAENRRREMVRPEGLEPPTLWFEGIDSLIVPVWADLHRQVISSDSGEPASTVASQSKQALATISATASNHHRLSPLDIWSFYSIASSKQWQTGTATVTSPRPVHAGGFRDEAEANNRVRTMVLESGKKKCSELVMLWARSLALSSPLSVQAC